MATLSFLLSAVVVLAVVQAAVIRQPDPNYHRYNVNVDPSSRGHLSRRYGQPEAGDRMLLDLTGSDQFPRSSRHRYHDRPQYKTRLANALRNHLSATRGRYQHTIRHTMDEFGGVL
ncbi:hypothetical protein SNE40_003975 [Patella caerulea]|uniref:Secreted protein n=1 Tax=Patella caerulea TaxID=87958 RepID=A0AAN8KF80_PATCE